MFSVKCDKITQIARVVHDLRRNNSELDSSNFRSSSQCLLYQWSNYSAISEFPLMSWYFTKSYSVEDLAEIPSLLLQLWTKLQFSLWCENILNFLLNKWIVVATLLNYTKYICFNMYYTPLKLWPLFQICSI